jgi:polar amino acid transport system substrate-binding protein
VRGGTGGAVTVAVLLLCSATAGCDDGAGGGSSAPSPELVRQDTLVACVEVPYAPFVVAEEDGDPTGFEVELLEHMAEGLDLDLEVRPTPYASLDTGRALRNGRCDVAAGALSVTGRRQEQMAFVDPHYAVMLSLLVHVASEVDSLSDLAGGRLAVQQGTSAETYARQYAPADVRLEALPGDQHMVDALGEGTVDGVLQELPVNLVHARTGLFSVVEQLPTGEQYAFAVRSDADTLRKSLDDQLARLRDDGSYRELYDHYFGVEE